MLQVQYSRRDGIQWWLVGGAGEVVVGGGGLGWEVSWGGFVAALEIPALGHY